jgi:3-dehydroquinate synthase
VTEKIQIAKDPASAVQTALTLGNYSGIAVLVDTHTRAHCYPLIKNDLPVHNVIEVPAGEEYKTLETCTKIWKELTAHGFDRDAVLIVLGGGVLGDMGGFCASTYKRGIAFILMPTTLLAQVDASIGGKLGVDFEHYKNHIGLFNEPVATLMVTSFLKTLPAREIKSGFAEIIKHCLSSDLKMWNAIRQKKVEEQDWEALIPHSIAFKSRIVSEDPKESGVRKILNLGHTIGHAIESHFLKAGQPLTHGEAIVIGLIAEAHISFQKKTLGKINLDQITGYLISEYGKCELPQSNELLPLMQQDKKNRGKEIRMALIDGVGRAVWDVKISENEIVNAISYYQSL